ncbi:MAG TPA: sugar phosphate isomerase/epimerase family protein [Pirellulaceae bacterium]|nr:sugar phosphate isomerase/epimerase family protein [Pirellulaceae bacterium]
MKFGMNLLLWTGELNESILPVCDMLKRMGYDGVEVPMFNYDLDYAAWGQRLDNAGLARTAVTIRTGADNPISADPAIRRSAWAANRQAVDCCQALGATHLVGPFHSALGEFSGRGPTAQEWEWGVEAMRDMAQYANSAGITIAIEPLNRFETYLLNTPADGARFAREVNHPACRIMYDTFHAHIEEKDVGQAIRQGGEMIAHVHISENDRSTPGAGAVRWSETFEALRDIRYNGWLMVEAFGLALPEIAAATKIWRRMFDSEEQLARDALDFMRRHIG